MIYEGEIIAFQDTEVSGISLFVILEPPGFVQELFCYTEPTAKALKAAFGDDYLGKEARCTLDEIGVLKLVEPVTKKPTMEDISFS